MRLFSQRNHRLSLLAVVIAFCKAQFLWAVSDLTSIQYSVRGWQIENGLPQNSVQAVVQTGDGYLWVGTQQGLARFDGVRFIVFNEKNVSEMKSANITVLTTGRDGSLWIGTERGGINRWKAGKFFHFGEAEGLASDAGVRGIFESSDGSVWIGTTNGLSRFQDGKFTRLGLKDGLSSNIVRWIDEDAQGNVWFATAAGLNCWKNGQITRPQNNTEAETTIQNPRVICVDHDGRIWAGGVARGLARFDGKATIRFTKADGLPDDSITAIYEDRHGEMWVGTYGGLNRFVNGKFVAELDRERHPFDVVNSIFEDREGNIWIGSRDGLYQLRPKRFISFTKEQGLTHNDVISLFRGSDGLWIGTWGGGLNLMKDGVISGFSAADNISKPPKFVLSLWEDHRGYLWVGSDFNGGAYRFGENKINRYTMAEGLPEVAVRVVFEDRKKNKWAGTSRGLYLYKTGRWSRFGVEEGLVGETIRVITEDRQGSLWVGTDAGLNCLQNGKFRNYNSTNGLSHNLVVALYEDGNRNLWIGTYGGGLNRLENGKFTSYTTKDGLFSDDIFEIIQDDFGFLWMTCRSGIFRVQKKDFDDFDTEVIDSLRCYAYGKSDGLVSVECSSIGKPAAIKTRDGNLWFATTKGLVMTDPRLATTENEISPPVVIEEIFADRKPFAKNVSVHLPPGRGEVEFRYTALSFQAPEKNLFKYKLDGVDSDWVEADTRRVAAYNNLAPGNYRFQVIACNNDGVWNEKGDAISLTIEPHLWQTGWFQAGTAFALIFFIGGTTRYVTRKKMLRRVELLEQQHGIERERSRIAQDIHDDLGTNLTQILLLSEVTKRAAADPSEVVCQSEKISTTARESIQAMDEIVWAVNPRNDNLSDFAGYLFQRAERLFALTDMRLRTDRPAILPAHPLGADVRHNLFLTVREALNNIVKHSGATEAWLRLSLENESQLTIEVEDNGRGFAFDATREFGNGLKNMRERVASLDGQYQIQSQRGGGTKMKITIKYK